MGRVITVATTLAVLSFLAYSAIKAKTPPGAAPPNSQPAQRLGNVRSAADTIGANDQKHVDDIENKTKSP